LGTAALEHAVTGISRIISQTS